MKPAVVAVARCVCSLTDVIDRDLAVAVLVAEVGVVAGVHRVADVAHVTRLTRAVETSVNVGAGATVETHWWRFETLVDVRLTVFSGVTCNDTNIRVLTTFQLQKASFATALIL